MNLRTVAAFLICASLPAAAYELRADSQGDVVRWRRGFELVIDKASVQAWGVPGAIGAITAAVATLDKATPELKVSVRVGESKGIGFRPSGLNQNDIVVLKEWPYDPKLLAATLVTLSPGTNEIIDADIAINASGSAFAVLEQSQGGNVEDVESMMLHELGHAVGLMHVDYDEKAVMYPASKPGDLSKRQLNDDDLQGLLALYEQPLSVESPPLRGCSTVPGALLVPVLALSLLRRRRA